MNTRWRIITALLGTLLVVSGTLLWHGKAGAPTMRFTAKAVEPLTVSVAADLQATYLPVLRTLADANHLELRQSDVMPDVAIGTGVTGTALPSLSAPVASLSGDVLVRETVPRLTIGTRQTLWNGTADIKVSDLVSTLMKPVSRLTVTALGDVIMGRTVLTMQKQSGDWLLPFRATAEGTKKAGLTLANLESDLSDTIAPPTDPHTMTFVGPAAQAAGLTYAGIDAVSLANNHSYNEGSAGFADTMRALDAAGVRYFGGGATDVAAHTPTLMTVNGVKVALLSYSAIIGSSAATATKNGMATFDAAPWGTLNEAQLARIEGDIRAAKAEADLVIPYFHWGAEYTHDPNADQREVAHRMIDAGADVVIGSHPHWTQGVEWYHGHLIAYSLGNFVFDQEWSLETKQGTYLDMTFADKKLVSATLVPYQIENYNQPRFLPADKGQAILDTVYAHSFWTP